MNSNKALKLFIILSRANRSVSDAVKKEIQKYGLNPTEFGVLEFLYHKGPQPIQYIGEKVLLSSGSMTYVIEQLKSKELVYRKNCEKDRRITYIELTDNGTALIASLFSAHKEFIGDLFSSMPETDIDALTSMLKQLGLSVSDRYKN